MLAANSKLNRLLLRRPLMGAAAQPWPWLPLLGLCLLLQGCGGGGGGGSAGPAEPAPTSLERATSAAKVAADTEASCNTVALRGTPVGLYWAIGDATGMLASGSRGAFERSTVSSVGSASKMISAIYLFETDSRLPGADSAFLNFTSGYATTPRTCNGNNTVAECYAAFGGEASFEPAKAGSYHYGPAHLQRLAVQRPQLLDMNVTALAAEFKRGLRLDADMAFAFPSLAGGARMSAASMSEVLTRLVAGGYRFRDALGSGSVCTTDCGTATSTPVPDGWRYGFGHWIESGCVAGSVGGCDGAYSTLGATGTYGWVDSDKRYWGLLAHFELPTGGTDVFMDSAYCGQKIRRAFLAQIGTP